MNKYIAPVLLASVILGFSTTSYAALNCPEVKISDLVSPYPGPFVVEKTERRGVLTFAWKGHIKVEGGVRNIQSIALNSPTPNAALECKYTVVQHVSSKSGSGKTLIVKLSDIEGLQPTLSVGEAQAAVNSFHNHQPPPPIQRNRMTWRLVPSFDIANLRTVETIALDHQSMSHFTPDGHSGGNLSYIYKLTQPHDHAEYLMELVGHADAAEIG